MKKNFIYGMAAIASMLFATSCSQEVLQEETANLEYINASFDVNGPEGINSRAIGDGTSVNTLVCATFDAGGNELTALRQYLGFETQTATYNVRLVKGQNYRVAFFAYYDGEDEDNQPDYYNISNLKEIAVLENQASNVELRDAFTAYHDIKYADDNNGTMQPIKQTVTLYRPFAQLNLGSRYDDWKAAIKAGVTITNTKVVVSNVYKVFSAYADQVVGEPTSMTFALNGLPNEDLVVKAQVEDDYTYVPEDGEEVGVAYKYLAMNYLLVGDKENEENLANIEFIWETADKKTNNPTTTFLNVPVQRNYRTNIIGWLLTNPAEFKINIDARFKNDYDIVAIDGTVNVDENVNMGVVEFVDQPNPMAKLTNKHITAEGTAITLDYLPQETQGAFYVGNSTIKAETFIEINGHFTLVVKDCYLWVDKLFENNSGRLDMSIIFQDCYINGQPLTKDNVENYFDTNSIGDGMVWAYFSNTDDNEEDDNDEPTDPEQGGNTGGGNNNDNEDEDEDDNTDGNEGEGTVSGNVSMSKDKDKLGTVGNVEYLGGNSGFIIKDKTFNGIVNLDENVENETWYFENVTFNQKIVNKKGLTIAFVNCNFSQKGLLENQVPSTSWVNVSASQCKINGENATTKDIKGKGW